MAKWIDAGKTERQKKKKKKKKRIKGKVRTKSRKLNLQIETFFAKSLFYSIFPSWFPVVFVGWGLPGEPICRKHCWAEVSNQSLDWRWSGFQMNAEINRCFFGFGLARYFITGETRATFSNQERMKIHKTIVTWSHPILTHLAPTTCV